MKKFILLFSVLSFNLFGMYPSNLILTSKDKSIILHSKDFKISGFSFERDFGISGSNLKKERNCNKDYCVLKVCYTDEEITTLFILFREKDAIVTEIHTDQGDIIYNDTFVMNKSYQK